MEEEKTTNIQSVSVDWTAFILLVLLMFFIANSCGLTKSTADEWEKGRITAQQTAYNQR